MITFFGIFAIQKCSKLKRIFSTSPKYFPVFNKTFDLTGTKAIFCALYYKTFNVKILFAIKFILWALVHTIQWNCVTKNVLLHVYGA